MHAKPGMRVRAGQPLITLHTDTPERFSRAREAVQGAYMIGDGCTRDAAAHPRTNSLTAACQHLSVLQQVLTLTGRVRRRHG